MLISYLEASSVASSAEGSKYAHWIGLYLSFHLSKLLGPFVLGRLQNLRASGEFGRVLTTKKRYNEFLWEYIGLFTVHLNFSLVVWYLCVTVSRINGYSYFGEAIIIMCIWYVYKGACAQYLCRSMRGLTNDNGITVFNRWEDCSYRFAYEEFWHSDWTG